MKGKGGYVSDKITNINELKVAKKTNGKTINSFYFEEEEKPKKKKVNTKKKKSKIKEKEEDTLFSFEDEIVIGVTKKEEPKKQENNKKKKPNTKKTVSNQSNKKKVTPTKGKKKPTKQVKKKTEKRPMISTEEREKRNKKRKRVLRFVKYGMLCVLLITVILCAMYSPLFNIKTIEVEGNELVSDNEIISLSQIQIEENTFTLSKRKVKSQIKENAYIENVTMIRKLPSTITLQIEERKPAYLLEYAGSYVYVDKQGYLLEINSEKLELPILQGAVTETAEFVAGNRLNREDLLKLSTVLKIMELAKNNEMESKITRIDIEDEENFKIIMETEEKTAYLGEDSNLNTKMLMVKAILEKTEGIAGDILVNMDLNKEYPVFRERV